MAKARARTGALWMVMPRKGSREELDEAHAGRVSAERTAAVQEARAESREQALLAKSNEWKVDRMRLEMLLENRTEQLRVADDALHEKEAEKSSNYLTQLVFYTTRIYYYSAWGVQLKKPCHVKNCHSFKLNAMCSCQIIPIFIV